MKVKRFTKKAMSAIEASEGPLFEAIADAFVALNKKISDESDDLETFAGWTIRNFANPPAVGFIYSFYRADVPPKVVVSSRRVRILERRSPELEGLKARFRRFHRTFHGKKGWNSFAERYHEKTTQRVAIERLAIGWIQGSVGDDEFVNACATVDARIGEQLRDDSAGPIPAETTVPCHRCGVEVALGKNCCPNCAADLLIVVCPSCLSIIPRNSSHCLGCANSPW